MTTLWENYNTGDDNQLGPTENSWEAQTFTVGASGHTLTSVKLKLYRQGLPGTCYIHIRATDGSGHPTGSDLASVSFDGSAVTDVYPGQWYEYSLGPITLNASTKYAIILACPNAGNYIYWRADISSPAYSGGNRENSSDAGVSWTSITAHDAVFEVWGGDASEYKDVSDTGSGADVVTSLNETADTSDSGSGVDAISDLTETVGVPDTGSGSDGLTSLNESLDIADTVAGVDSPAVTEGVLVTDDGAGVESASYTEFDERVVSDSGVGIDSVWLYRSQLVIDSTVLPHVDSANVAEPSIVLTKPSSSPPLRLWRGKRGREVTIKGRADTQAEITAIKAFNDGVKHALHLPTGDSFRVLITDVKPDDDVESPDQIPYTVTVKETT